MHKAMPNFQANPVLATEKCETSLVMVKAQTSLVPVKALVALPMILALPQWRRRSSQDAWDALAEGVASAVTAVAKRETSEKSLSVKAQVP